MHSSWDTLRRQPWFLGFAALALAVAIAPFATADTGDRMKVGARNFADKETRIIGDTTGYSTRQSNGNEGDGGSATYGCRSSSANEPCLFVYNVRQGRAFDFRSKWTTGGRIMVYGGSEEEAKPFTTNANGVATGLNADRVDGLDASEIKVGCPSGTVGYAGACIESAVRSAEDYRDASKACGDAGRRLPTVSELMGFRLLSGVTLSAGEATSDLDEDDAPGAFEYVTVNDAGTPARDGIGSTSPFRCVAPLRN